MRDKPKNNELSEEDKIKENQKMEDKHNKNAGNLFLFLGMLVLFFGIWMFMSYKQTHFDYKGIDFQKVKEIAPYRTSLKPSYSSGITGSAVKNIEYNFYIRNDPRELDTIPFVGDLNIKDSLFFSSKDDFNCNGDGIIGIQNLAQLYQVLGARVMKTGNESCIDGSMFIKIESGSETKIEQIGESCYVMSITNCEILKATERFMTKTLVEVEKKRNE